MFQLFGHVPTIVLDEADVYHTGRLKNVTYRILGELVDPFKYFKVSKQIPKPKQLVYVAATLNKFGKFEFKCLSYFSSFNAMQAVLCNGLNCLSVSCRLP